VFVSPKLDCPFCLCVGEQRVVAEHGTVFAVLDKYPVTVGHHLVIPKRHVVDYFDLSDVAFIGVGPSQVTVIKRNISSKCPFLGLRSPIFNPKWIS
jgi:hypothetical protein